MLLKEIELPLYTYKRLDKLSFFSFPSSIFQKHSTNVVYNYILQLSFINVKKKDK